MHGSPGCVQPQASMQRENGSVGKRLASRKTSVHIPRARCKKPGTMFVISTLWRQRLEGHNNLLTATLVPSSMRDPGSEVLLRPPCIHKWPAPTLMLTHDHTHPQTHIRIQACICAHKITTTHLCTYGQSSGPCHLSSAFLPL